MNMLSRLSLFYGRLQFAFRQMIEGQFIAPEVEMATQTLTWSCMVCKDIRPDEFISVVSHMLILNGKKISYGQVNVRHCNDNKECITAAQDEQWARIGR